MGGSTQTTTTSPPSQVLQNYAGLTNRAQGVANTPYQPYTGELTAPINQGQSNSIGQLQSAYGTANPYLNAGSGYLNSAASGLGGVQNYLQAGSQAVAGGQQYQGQAAGLANPNANAAYMDPYRQSVIDTTMASAQNQDAQQAQRLASGSIGNGSFGGDRAGVAQAALAGQQALANNQTIAQLNSQNYQQANTNRQADAGIYGNLANSANQSAAMYGGFGQTQGQTSAAMGQLAGQAGNLGNTAQSTAISGASAGLQASTLQQQNQQAQDTANYGQFQNSIQYPFQTTNFLSNIEQGVGNSSGNSTTSPGPSYASQAAGAATAGLGILGQIGGSGGVKAGYNTVSNGIMSVLGGSPFASYERGGRVEYAHGGGLGGLRGHYADGGDPNAPPGLNFAASGLTGGQFDPTAGTLGGRNDAQAANYRQIATGLAARPANSLGVTSAPPVAQSSPVAGLAPDGSGSPPGGGSGADSSGGTPFGGGRNVSQALTAAGFGMMAGTSPFAMANIGQGGLAGMQAYQQLNAQDRQNALAQSEIATRTGDLGVRQKEAEIAAQRLAQEADQFGQKNKLAASQIESENATRRAGLITQTFTPAGPYGKPGFIFNDRSGPEPRVYFKSIDEVMPNGAPSPSPASPSPAATPGQAPTAAPASAPPDVGTPASPAPSSVPNPPAPSAIPVYHGPTDIPQGYVPPNQMNITYQPEDAKNQSELGKTQVANYRGAADSATAAEMRLAEMDQNMAKLPRKGGYLVSGVDADARKDVAVAANTFFNQFGMKGPFDPNQVASMEQMQKDTFNLGAELSKQIGGKEPGFIVQSAVKANPGINNTYQGYKNISAALHAANQYKIDKADFMNNYYAKYNHLDGAQTLFQQQNPWQNYAKTAALAQYDPRDVAALKANAKDPSVMNGFDEIYGRGSAKDVVTDFPSLTVRKR